VEEQKRGIQAPLALLFVILAAHHKKKEANLILRLAFIYAGNDRSLP
jgi:hypothetical protein